MRNFLFRLGSIAEDVAFILSREYALPCRSRLLRDYLRLRIKVFLNRWIYFRTENFLGYTVSFANYSLFFETFRQIFIRQSYYFISSIETPTIVDCGGNAGVSVLYFKYLYPQSKITVFEPSEEVRPILIANIELNSLSDVKVEPYAVSTENGTATFFERGTGSCGNTLMESVFESTDRKGANKEDKLTTVETRKLSRYIKTKIDLLKLDIEGAESGVIRELAESGTLADIHTIVMEYHYYPANTENRLGGMLNIFEKEDRNYQIFMDEIAPGTSTLLQRNNGYYCLLRATQKK